MLKNIGQKILDESIVDREIENLIKTLSKNGKVYLVGGAVRDALLGKAGKDLDLAYSLTPQASQKILEAHNFKVVPTGIAHGTISVVLSQGNIEITSFRLPGKRLSNEYADNIETDLLGRDFTINAIAYEPITRHFIDPYQGLRDLENKCLRSPGSAADRIAEDPLRILRMLRFGPAAGFTCDPELLKACKQQAQALKDVSPERIQQEPTLILTSQHVREALSVANQCQVFEVILPEIIPSIGCLQNDFHIEDVFEHTLTVIERSENQLIQRLTALFHDLGKPATLSIDQNGRRHFYKHEEISAEIAEAVMLRLKFSKQLTQSVKKLVAYHMRPLECGPAAIRRLLRDLDDLFEHWLKFKQADKPPVMPETEFQEQLQKFVKLYEAEVIRAAGKPYGKLAVTGSDLINIGLQPGPKMGALMKEMEEQVLENPEKNTYDYLIEFAKKQVIQ